MTFAAVPGPRFTTERVTGFSFAGTPPRGLQG